MGSSRNRYTRGGGGWGGGGTTLAFPPFTRAIKWLVIANTAVYLLMLVLGGFAPRVAADIGFVGMLRPALVLHGWIWQLVTYSFLHAGLFHILFNMLTLWMFGSALESSWGHRQFLEFYFYAAIFAALTTIGIAYLALTPALSFLAITPATATLGASGATFGVMVAFAMLFGDQEFFLFPLPIAIKAKYLVAILILIALAGSLTPSRGESVAYFAHLGGALFGWLYIKYAPRRGLGFAASERYFGVRNAYYKWKRRRAARKFEVYMRKHDRTAFFDEYGNYKGHDEHERGKGNGEARGGDPWVQ
jgi:membrane associated rhomboid family serine protease